MPGRFPAFTHRDLLQMMNRKCCSLNDAKPLEVPEPLAKYMNNIRRNFNTCFIPQYLFTFSYMGDNVIFLIISGKIETKLNKMLVNFKLRC